MKVLIVLCAIAAGVSAKFLDIDWSRVNPIEEFDHYWARIPADWQWMRGLEVDRRITNGVEAHPGQFPYQVIVLSDFPMGTGFCGGSLLNTHCVLTAAHCVDGASGGIAIMGAHNRNLVEAEQQRISFVHHGIHIHEEYVSTNIRNDVAVIRLAGDVVYTPRIQPVHYTHDNTNTFSGVTGTVSGFGRTSDTSQDLSSVLRYTSNPIMTNADCLASWGGNTDLIQAQNICLSGVNGRSACGGDSGGPLTVAGDRDHHEHHDHPSDTVQVGIVSFGSAAGCATGMPSVYARVSIFSAWIDLHTDHDHHH
ncbi:brachyurin-like [Uranotaenia lowii]|uniref:brachyurin-like n=1 Tax=Uranotaenia lowii TaxID=190385 RepID=UPI00247ADE3A|nr:brachyurin-like [Uranotaenia lowii]